MATASERRKLHNFSLPKWGKQKLLKFGKVSSDPNSSSSSSPSLGLDHPPTHSPNEDRPPSGTTIEEVSINVAKETVEGESTEQLIPIPVAEQSGDIGSSSGKVGVLIPEPERRSEIESATATGKAKPWNLRKRRTICEDPEKEYEFANAILSLSLSKAKVEEDFAAMVGAKPPRAPRKRPRALQRQLDLGFPGLSLTEITLDSYKVSSYSGS